MGKANYLILGRPHTMAWHISGGHISKAETMFTTFSFGELFEDCQQSRPYNYLFKDVVLNRDVPPFKRGTKVLVVNGSRYFYQARLQFTPIHKPTKGLPCSVCMQFERTTQEEVDSLVALQSFIPNVRSAAASTVSASTSTEADIVAVEPPPPKAATSSQTQASSSAISTPLDMCIFCAVSPPEGMKKADFFQMLRHSYEKKFGPLNEGCEQEKSWHKWDVQS
jgi:hypothetical protein